MFSGIVEAIARLTHYAPENPSPATPTRIRIEKPSKFNDINAGDSIAVNGVCLTVEGFDEREMQFCLGTETLRVTGWSALALLGQFVNLERSLKWSDRIHGHLVSGHIDAMGEISFVNDQAGCRDLRVAVADSLLPYFWQKGSITLNGVSLTVNQVKTPARSLSPAAAHPVKPVHGEISVTLIPETLARTNLAELKVGDQVTIEIDQMARALMQMLEQKDLVTQAKAARPPAEPSQMSTSAIQLQKDFQP